MEPSQVEARALRLSLAAYLFMAILGIAFAVLTRSSAILLDGSFNFISLVIALIAMRVSRLQDIQRSDNFHFGYAQFEPLLNIGRIITPLLVTDRSAAP